MAPGTVKIASGSRARSSPPYARMLQVARSGYGFDPRIADAVVIVDHRRQAQCRDIDVFVDRHAQHGTARSFVIFGVVGAATEETDPERRAGDGHHGALSPAGFNSSTRRTPSVSGIRGRQSVAARKRPESRLL